METIHLYQGLTFLSYATGIIVVVVGIMLAKLIFDISKLTKNINETTEIVKTELEPTLKNVNKSVEIVSGLIIKTDESINKVKEFVKNSPLGMLGKVTNASGKLIKGVIKGFSIAFKMFSKK